MRPKDRGKKYKYGHNSYGGQAKEAILIEDAAIKTFSKIFKNIKSSKSSKVSNLVITVSGTSSMDRFWAVYTANANAIVSLASGEKLGEYDAVGKAGGLYKQLNDPSRLKWAYVNAFVQISETMLKDERLAKYFENGFGEIQTANLLGRAPMPQPPKVAKIPETRIPSPPQSGSGSGFKDGSRHHQRPRCAELQQGNYWRQRKQTSPCKSCQCRQK